jgi:hypothetical protein
LTDRFTVRVVVCVLGIGVLGGLAALAYLAMTQTAIPDQLDRLITFLAGGLASVLATTRSSGEEPQPVQVTNTTTDPVVVDQLPEFDDIPSTGSPLNP